MPTICLYLAKLVTTNVTSFITALSGFLFDDLASSFSCHGYLLSCPQMCQTVDSDGCKTCGGCSSFDPSHPGTQVSHSLLTDPSRPGGSTSGDPSNPLAGKIPYHTILYWFFDLFWFKYTCSKSLNGDMLILYCAELCVLSFFNLDNNLTWLL